MRESLRNGRGLDDSPVSSVPRTFSTTVDRLKGQHVMDDPLHPRSVSETRKERTCYPHNRPQILGREHGLQDSSHRGELQHTAYGCDRERGANVQVKHMRDRRVDYDKGETYADV